MPLDHKQLKRVAERGMRKVHGPASGDKTNITVVVCVNAAGTALPPMVIFKGGKLIMNSPMAKFPISCTG